MSGADLPKMGEEEGGKITRQGGEEAPSLCEGLVFSNTSLRSDPRRGRGNRIYLLESCFSSENLHVVGSWIVLVRQKKKPIKTNSKTRASFPVYSAEYRTNNSSRRILCVKRFLRVFESALPVLAKFDVRYIELYCGNADGTLG